MAGSMSRLATSSCRVASASTWPRSRAEPGPVRTAGPCGWSVPTGRRPGQKNFRMGRKKFCWRQEPPGKHDVDGQAPGEAPQPLTLNHPASNPGRVSDRGSSFFDPAGRDIRFGLQTPRFAGEPRPRSTVDALLVRQVASSTLRSCVASKRVARSGPGARTHRRMAPGPSFCPPFQQLKGIVRVQWRLITRLSRWTISARPEKPRIDAMSADARPMIFCASGAS